VDASVESRNNNGGEITAHGGAIMAHGGAIMAYGGATTAHGGAIMAHAIMAHGGVSIDASILGRPHQILSVACD
jgi:hypothetical protein